MYFYLIFALSTFFFEIYECKIKFPFRSLYDLPEDYPVATFDFLCEGNLSNTGCCNCNESCMRFKTCCIDKLWDDKNPLPINEYLQLFINKTKEFKDTACKSVFPPITGSEKVLMVSSCTQGANEKDIEGCESPRDLSYASIVPVFDEEKYLYKNSFCARCNFVKSFQLVNLTADCNGLMMENPLPFGNILFKSLPENNNTITAFTTQTPNSNLFEQLRGCSFRVKRTSHLSHIYIQECDKENYPIRINKCHKERHHDLCMAYFGRVRNYANLHCIFCKNETLNSTIPLMCPQKILPHTVILDWSFTLSFSSKTNMGIKGSAYKSSNSVNCGEDKLYNILSGKCEVFSCSENYEKVGSTCQEKNFSHKFFWIRNPTFDKCIIRKTVSLIALINSTNINVTRFTIIFQSEVNISTHINFSIMIVTNYQTYLQGNLTLNNITLSRLIRTFRDPKLLLWQTVDQIFISSMEKQIRTLFHGVDLYRSYPGRRLCVKPEIRENITGNFTETCSYCTDNNIVNSYNTTFLIKFERHSFKRLLATCSDFYLHSSCPLQILKSNYTISKNKTLIIADTNKSLSTFQYVPLISGIGICFEETKSIFGYQWLAAVSEIKRYLSIIGTSLSIVAYVSIILIFSYIKKLSDVPSMIIVALCSTLLFADVSFMIATQIYRFYLGCKIIAILLHWSLLSSHIWTVVMAFDVLSKFGSLAMSLNKEIKKRILQYSASVFFTSSAIMLMSVILNEKDIYKIGYGEQETCFIAYFYPRLFLYVVPVSVIFVTTFTSCTLTLYFLLKHEKRSRKLLQKTRRRTKDMVTIAFKLILTLGVVEVIGFMQISKSGLSENELIFNATFSVIYIIFRSLRGVILFFIYITNKQTIVLIKSRFRTRDTLLQRHTKSNKSNSTSITKL